MCAARSLRMIALPITIDKLLPVHNFYSACQAGSMNNRIRHRHSLRALIESRAYSLPGGHCPSNVPTVRPQQASHGHAAVDRDAGSGDVSGRCVQGSGGRELRAGACKMCIGHNPKPRAAQLWVHSMGRTPPGHHPSRPTALTWIQRQVADEAGNLLRLAHAACSQVAREGGFSEGLQAAQPSKSNAPCRSRALCGQTGAAHPAGCP